MENKWKNEFSNKNSLCCRKIYDDKIVKITDRSIANGIKILINILHIVEKLKIRNK